jgi:hypothetical protein
VRVVWDGFTGAPGYTSLYFDPASAPPLAAIKSFFGALTGLVPTGLRWSYPQAGDTIDEITGHITGAWTAGPQTASVGVAAGSYVGSSGAVVLWRTSDPIAGRRPVGKTYLVPLATSQFGTDGQVSSSAVSTILSAALSFVTAASAAFKVWHRPIIDPVTHAVTRPGSAVTCIGATVPQFAAVMRSRRR